MTRCFWGWPGSGAWSVGRRTQRRSRIPSPSSSLSYSRERLCTAGPADPYVENRGRVSSVPRLTVGLPVYNGERFLGQALDSLLGQTFEDFELIVADNAVRRTARPRCVSRYAKMDSRIRYVRHPHNIGLIPNHTFVMDEAKGELFKYAAHDDLYGRDLLALCVQALDEDPDAVIAHSWTAMVDESASGHRHLRAGRCPGLRAGTGSVSQCALRGLPRLGVRGHSDQRSPAA